MAYDSYTKLLIHFNGANGATAYAAETGQVCTFHGDAQLSTTGPLLGSASLSVAGAGDFTIELLAKCANFAGRDQDIIGQCIDTNNLWIISCSNGTWHFLYKVGGVMLAWYYFSASPDATGHHIEIDRHGSDFYFFIDGVAQTLTVENAIGSTSLTNIATDLTMGQVYLTSNYEFAGLIDEVRISKGIARHIADFAPPNAEYSEMPRVRIRSKKTLLAYDIISTTVTVKYSINGAAQVTLDATAPNPNPDIFSYEVDMNDLTGLVVGDEVIFTIYDNDNPSEYVALDPMIITRKSSGAAGAGMSLSLSLKL